MPDTPRVEPASGESIISFSVREVLGDIQKGLGEIRGLLQNKADQGVVENLEARILVFEREETYRRALLATIPEINKEVSALKAESVSKAKLEEYVTKQSTQRNWLIGTGVTAALSMLGLILQALPQ